jgi:hypothetical protein
MVAVEGREMLKWKELMNENQSIILPQVHATAIFRVLTIYRSCKRGRVRTVNLDT